VRDRLAFITACDAEPASGLAAARTPRYEEDVPDR
jgi:hypothetical protein